MATNRHRHFSFSCFSSSAEAGSSQPDDLDASSSNQTQPALREIIQKKDIAKVEGKFVVDTLELIQHISELLELREKEKLRYRSKPDSFFEWPSAPGFNKLKEILSLATDSKKLAELVKSGLDLVSALKDIISGPVKTVLTDIGKASLATAGLLLVAYTLERLDNLSSNQEECWLILKQMSFVARVVYRLEARPEVIQDLIERATILIAEGAIMCCSKMDSSPWRKFFLSQKIKQDLRDIRERLKVMDMHINMEIGIRIFDATQSKGRSTYPRHAVGIAEPVEKVFRLLEIQGDDQNAVTVILHGFGGMGKTTLADAVFSEIGGEGIGKIALADAGFWKIGGGKRSKVRLFDGIKSTPDITALQKQILKDLMEPGETPPEISTHKDGQQALEGVLRKIHAFIYIDNVLEAAALEKLLPQDMTTAKKVRLLLTARNEKVSDACPRSRTEPKFYNMQTIHDPEAMVILKREIEEGLTEDQFSDIIQICGGIPLMLTIAAGSIGHDDNKEEAYARLKEQKGTNFEEMRYAFAYETLPHECKDPFQDICTYFNGWNWNIVKDIVGDDALMKLKSRALVTRTTNGFASVHDIIIALAHGMSKEESKDKEVRCKFTNASELKKFLEEGDTEGITGIWLTERKEDGDDRKEVVVQASALDKMQKSLRVLHLGNSVKVEGNCNEIFKELCFLKANISRLPFTVSQLTQLRYLSYDPPNWVLSRLPSSLAIINFNGKTFHTYK